MELQFLNRVESLESKLMKEDWLAQYDSIIFPSKEKLDHEGFGHFGMFIFDALFAAWSRLLVEDERVAVEIASGDLVAKYSRPVVYYVAGWTLQRASLALTIGEQEREMYFAFASSQSISKETAKAENLPCSLVELRQKKKLFYPSKEYFSFILLVETTYIKNLNLKIMMAFMEGDLVQEINDAILGSELMRSNFFSF